MKVSYSILKKIIREELGRIADVREPSEVGAVEDAWAGGKDLDDPFVWMTPDRKADEEKPPKRRPIQEGNEVEEQVKRLVDVVGYLSAARDDLEEAIKFEQNLPDGDVDLYDDLHNSVDSVFTEIKNALGAVSRGKIVKPDDIKMDLPGEE